MGRDLGLKLRNPIFGRAQLVRQLLSHIDGVPAIPLSNVGGLVKKL
jgi:hypothetical protein